MVEKLNELVKAGGWYILLRLLLFAIFTPLIMTLYLWRYYMFDLAISVLVIVALIKLIKWLDRDRATK